MNPIRSSSRALAVAGLVGSLALLAGACSQGPNLPAQSAFTASAPARAGCAQVLLLYSSFEPAAVTIHQGGCVEWMWRDYPNPHDVSIRDYVDTDGTRTAIESPIQQEGVWYQVFDTPGTYHYDCTIHAQMVGVVVVTAGTSGPTGATGGGAGVSGSTGYGATYGTGAGGTTGTSGGGAGAGGGVSGATGAAAGTTGTTGA